MFFCFWGRFLSAHGMICPPSVQGVAECLVWGNSEYLSCLQSFVPRIVFFLVGVSFELFPRKEKYRFFNGLTVTILRPVEFCTL